MQQLLDLYKKVLEFGELSTDRTGVGTLKLVGQTMRFNLQEGYPAPTTKRLAWNAMSSELIWFLEGSHDERRLCEILHGTRDPSKKTIWTANYENQGISLGYTDGNLGPVYGKQWRFWKDTVLSSDPYEIEKYKQNGYNVVDSTFFHGVIMERNTDQIAVLIDGLKNNPDSRRHILTAWNVGELDKMALPPCHCFSQFFVNNGKLSCILYQRSCDLFLGVPFNIASYSLLTHMLAQVCGLEVGEFVWMGGDVHIYQNHVEQVKEQLKREPREMPKLWMDTSITKIEDFKMDSFRLEGYNPDGVIKAPMAV
ncbi:hypothetical protein pEaSNUABM49_00219 [Erwinia phage pEa_SNUABM_49]|nr:hypothetical protein pEaSNUABM49_00219 [Erwinia phage pEa_SNUABM_49]